MQSSPTAAEPSEKSHRPFNLTIETENLTPPVQHTSPSPLQAHKAFDFSALQEELDSASAAVTEEPEVLAASSVLRRIPSSTSALESTDALTPTVATPLRIQALRKQSSRISASPPALRLPPKRSLPNERIESPVPKRLRASTPIFQSEAASVSAPRTDEYSAIFDW